MKVYVIMWRLTSANLRYQWRTAIYGLCVALMLATVVNVVLPALGLGPEPDDDFKLFYFYPISVVFLGLFLAFHDFASQRKESRLVAHVLLPATRLQICLARMLSPIALLMACFLFSIAIMLLTQLVMEIELAAWRCYFLAYFAGFFFVLLQGAALVEELKPALRRSNVLQFAFVGAIMIGVGIMLLRSLGRYVDLLPHVAAAIRTDISIDPESLSSSLFLHGLGWSMMLLSTTLFTFRRTMTD